MKKYLILLTILIFTSVNSYEQILTFAPKGAIWTFKVIYFGYLPSEKLDYRQWISTGDTLVNGQICRVIQRKGERIYSDISDKIIVYEENNIVYWYNASIKEFTILYDFNKNKGDSWIIKTDTCDLKINVDSTGLELINGFSLKTLYISSESNSFYGKIYQHIGNIYKPNPDINYTCYGWWVDVNFYHGLRCYEDSIFGFHDFKIAPNCKFVVATNDIITNNHKLNIYPNPFNIQTTLSLDENIVNGTLIITNIYGKIVQQKNNISGNSINLLQGQLRNGLYFIQIIQFNKIIATGRLIVSG